MILILSSGQQQVGLRMNDDDSMGSCAVELLMMSAIVEKVGVTSLLHHRSIERKVCSWVLGICGCSLAVVCR